MADQGRQRRVAERIRESVARTLERKVKDPRLGFVTITDVRVTGDLQHATVYYTVMGDEEEQKKTRRALESAKGLIRSEVGAALGTRLTPTISFQLDALPTEAASIEDALRAAREKDAQIAAASAGKEYAGDSAPYVTDAEVADEELEVDRDLREDVEEDTASAADSDAEEK